MFYCRHTSARALISTPHILPLRVQNVVSRSKATFDSEIRSWYLTSRFGREIQWRDSTARLDHELRRRDSMVLFDCKIRYQFLIARSTDAASGKISSAATEPGIGMAAWACPAHRRSSRRRALPSKSLPPLWQQPSSSPAKKQSTAIRVYFLFFCQAFWPSDAGDVCATDRPLLGWRLSLRLVSDACNLFVRIRLV